MHTISATSKEERWPRGDVSKAKAQNHSQKFPTVKFHRDLFLQAGDEYNLRRKCVNLLVTYNTKESNGTLVTMKT